MTAIERHQIPIYFPVAQAITRSHPLPVLLLAAFIRIVPRWLLPETKPR
jgi:hypothetical protein